MLTEKDLFQLVAHYHLDKNCDFDGAIEMASNELPAVLDKEREYPPFIYYLCLEHINGNPKYKFGKTFRQMNDEEKTNVFNETIAALKALLA